MPPSLLFVSVLILTMVTSCGKGRKAGGPAADSLEQAVTIESGRLRITARPVRIAQKEALDLTVGMEVVDSASRAPVDGLVWNIVPFMPTMGHGTSVKPEAHALPNGTYRIEHVNLFMPGPWELRATSTGPVNDRFAVPIEVVP